jgi:hypothetical protein
VTLGVRESTPFVVANAASVWINQQAIPSLVERLLVEQPAPPAWNTHYHLDGPAPVVQQYLRLLDALNFSFWGDPKWGIEYAGEWIDGYWALAAALKRAILDGVRLLDSAFLSTIDRATLGHVLAGNVEIPMLDERVSNAREVGRFLAQEGAGAGLSMVAGRDVERFVETVVSTLPTFDDRASFQGREVRFLKRAQLLAADLVASGAVPPWSNMESLTAFADYQLPRVLRAFGVLDYSPDLARRVDAKIEIAAGSAEEVEIRAATIQAVEGLVEAMRSLGANVTSAEVDYRLWHAAQGELPNDRPYHRTRTIFY